MEETIYERFPDFPINEEEMEKFEKLSPATTKANKVRELFKQDPLLRLYWNQKTFTVSIHTPDPEKARAIRYILPEEDHISDCEILKIDVYLDYEDVTILVGRTRGYHYSSKMLNKAFDKNPLWVYTHEWEHKAISNVHCWCGFVGEPVFYVDDNLQNLYGDSAFLPVDLAKEVLDTNGIHYCTYNKNRKLIKKNTVANSLYQDTIDWDEE